MREISEKARFPLSSVIWGHSRGDTVPGCHWDSLRVSLGFMSKANPHFHRTSPQKACRPLCSPSTLFSGTKG